MITSMPGKSYRGELPALSENEKIIQENLRAHVYMLAGEIGERNMTRYAELEAAANYIEKQFSGAGHVVMRQSYSIGEKTCHNLEVEISGTDRKDEIVVVGGHYDTVDHCPGANDNGTGTAAVLELARLFAEKKSSRTLRFVAFVNEEPVYFQTGSMGSRVYSRRCRKRNENIVAMLSLETMGYYSDEEKSQAYPFPFSMFYPSTGNFIGFVGNLKSRDLVRQVVRGFRQHTKFPSEGGAFPEFIPGAGWSDHWSFWQEGYPGVMVTDTAPFRYPHYHESTDTPDRVDYGRLSRVVAGLEKVIEELATKEYR